MNSKERHEQRYIRRKAKRDKRKKELNLLYGDYLRAISVTELIKGFWPYYRKVGWKPSVQRYGFNLYKNVLTLNKKLLLGQDTFKGFYQFEIFERGKKRNIRSIHISEKCIEKSLAQNIYVPMLRNSLIYDNSASLQGRGTGFARKRLLKMLSRWYRQHGNKGVAIIGDFTKFFDSIDHKVLLKILDDKFSDKRVVDYARRAISHYGDIGLGLGSELNQIFAISVPNKMDHLIKCKLGVKFYHRYNDDFVILLETKEEAKKILEEIRKVTSESGITLSEKKTHIVDISQGFSFLKKRYILTDSGRIVIKHNRRNIRTEKAKLRKFKKAFDKGLMTMDMILQQYRSWRGYLKHTPATSKNYSKRFKNEYKTITMMDKLFNELFIEGGQICLSM